MTAAPTRTDASDPAARRQRGRRVIRLLAAAVWTGLAAGAIEIALVQIALRGGVAVRLSADYPWMAALANVAIAIGLTVLVLTAAWLKPRWNPTATAVAGLVGMLVAVPVLYLEMIHKAAVAVLAAGIGSQVGRLATGDRFRLSLRLLLPTGAFFAAWIGYSSWRIQESERRSQRSAVSALAAPPAGAPNVVLLILDTVRRRVSWHRDSTDVTTPAVEAIARRGVSFDFAVAPAPWTLPSHASFFTGKHPHQLSASLSAPLDGTFPTLAEYLTSKGYFTVGFVANLSFATQASGLARGFLQYHDYDRSAGQVAMSSSIGRSLLGAGWLRRLIGNHELANRRHGGEIVDDYLAWQDRHSDRPYFAFINLFDAHEPYFPEGYAGSMLWPGPRWSRYEHVVGLEAGANAEVEAKWALDASARKVHQAAYRRATKTADDQAARLIAELDRRGELRRTVVIVASDHGELTGEHDRFGHLNGLYLPALHVPLAMIGPSLPQGARVAGVAGLNDLPATVVDLLGLKTGSPFPGRSLTRLLEPQPPEDTVLSTLVGGYARQARYPIGAGGTMHSLTTNTLRYIRNADGSEELYDLSVDGTERTNLASDPSRAEHLSAFRATLQRLLAQ